jgi:hypothetical protein
LIEEEEEINLNIWKNVKSQFQHHFPTKMKTPIVEEMQKVHPKTKATLQGLFLQSKTKANLRS